MKKYILYHIAAVILLLFACTKITDTAKEPEVIVGSTVTNKDTTIVTIGDVVIRHYQTTPCFPSNEVFTFTATTTAPIPSNAVYNWYFGDGSQAVGATVQHSYNATSPYVVLLNITDANKVLLKAGTFSVQAWGQQIKPVAIFSTKQDFSQNDNYITFNSASSINKGSIIQYNWDWNDGKTEKSAVGLTRHEFPKLTSDKTYLVKLTITSSASCTDDTTMRVTIPATYPITGSFNAVAYDACTKEYFLFTPTATNVPGGSVYKWNFSDGRGDTTAGIPIKYTYKYMNDYDVIMSIYLNNRLIYKTHKMVGAKGEDPKPISLFYKTFVKSDASTETWSFNSQSLIAHGGIDGYYWDFGNGNTNSDYNRYVENVYQRSATNTTYSVRLITTGNGCADTAYTSVLIPK